MDVLLLAEEDSPADILDHADVIRSAGKWNTQSAGARRALRGLRKRYDHYDSLRRYFLKPFTDQLRVRLPPLPHMPNLGVVTLGTHLKRAGFSVGVIDNFERIPKNRARLEEALSGPLTAVGLSTNMIMDPAHLKSILGDLRRRRPDVPIILGGATSRWQAWARDLADIVVVSHGENTLAEVLRRLKSDRPLAGVPNLHYKERGRWVSTERRANFTPAEVSRPDWSLLEVHPSRCFPLEASKGCRYDCAFCTFPDRGNQKFRPSEALLDELRANHEKHGVTLYRLSDSNFTSWPEKTAALCREIAALRLPLSWSCYARVDDLARHPPLARAMREAGCFLVNCGIESGDDGLLKSMHKGYGRAEIKQGVRRAREAGLLVHASFIIGFPGETEKTVESTMSLIDELELDTVALYRLTFLNETDTKLWQRRARWGISGGQDTWEHATMNAADAQDHVDRCTERLIAGRGKTVLGSEFLNTYLQGWGLTAEDAMDYFRALRDFHRARGAGDAAGEKNGAARVRRHASTAYRAAYRLAGIPHPPVRDWFAPAACGPRARRSPTRT